MRRNFKFQVWGCQNSSNEPWIRATKFRQKPPIPSEVMDKIQSEFPRSGINKVVDFKIIYAK